MAKRLPFSDTKVEVESSIAEITKHLISAGFDQIGQTYDKGTRSVFAQSDGAMFYFEVNLNSVQAALMDSLSDRRRGFIEDGDEDEVARFKHQCAMCGWRLLAGHVKAVADAIKLGVVTPAQAFAGHLLLTKKGGKPYTLADHVDKLAGEGNLNSQNIMAPMLLEHKP